MQCECDVFNMSIRYLYPPEQLAHGLKMGLRTKQMHMVGIVEVAAVCCHIVLFFYWPACTKKPFPTPSNPKKEAYVIMDLMCKVSTVYKKAPHLCLVYIHHVWLCA